MEEERRSSTPSSNNRRTSIAFAVDPPRRSSMQLGKSGAAARREVAPGPQSAGLPPTNLSSELLPQGRTRQRSLSSPPPPPTFIKRVSFDTFDNRDASDFSLTLKSKHKDYAYSRQSRTFLCGTDQNVYSTTALEWLMEELVDDGDEIVCLRVLEKDSKMISDHSVQEKLYRKEAEKLLQEIIAKNEEDKAISVILEYSVGKIHDSIQRMIHIYEPVMLIVGTRGRSLGGIQGLLPGSVSKYCLQHSPVPVIVVRPSTKREKKKKKRQEDPARRTYLDIMNKSSELSTIHMLQSNSSSTSTGKASTSGTVTPTTVGTPRLSTISFALPDVVGKRETATPPIIEGVSTDAGYSESNEEVKTQQEPPDQAAATSTAIETPEESKVETPSATTGSDSATVTESKDISNIASGSTKEEKQ